MRAAPLGPEHQAEWEALVATHPAAGFMQSWDWSEFKRLEGYRVVRIGLFEGRRLRGGGIAYSFPSPTEGHLAAMPDGPVLDWDGPASGRAFRAVVAAVRAQCGAEVVTLRVEPPLTFMPEPLRGLPRSPLDLVPDDTLWVDLGPEAEMLARMKPKGRYNARLALRRGVEATSSTDPEDVHEFYTILEQTARYQDFRLEPKRFFINLVQALFPKSGHFAFARYKGMLLAAALVVRSGATTTYLYGGHLPLFPEVMASAALHWHLLREAARAGGRVYDFYGYIPPGRPGHPYDRFSRFKEKFGGRPVHRIGSHDVVFHDRLAAAAIRALRSAPAVRPAVAGEPACLQASTS
jgi:peptidoglycan pentaglycine glycine transferase (the first glycine)